MQPQFHMTGQATQEVALQQNRVLRNTFMLLALSMVPTVFGAVLGMSTSGIVLQHPVIAHGAFLLDSTAKPQAAWSRRAVSSPRLASCGDS